MESSSALVSFLRIEVEASEDDATFQDLAGAR
jgi:hypothetical protein